MTPAQEKAFTHIEEIMREHFDAGAFIVLANLEGDDHGKEEVRAGWHGGKAQSIGLFTMGADRSRGLVDVEIEP